MTTPTVAPTRVRSEAEKARIRQHYGQKTASEAKQAARTKAIRQSYVDKKIKAWVETKKAEGKAAAKAKRIAAYYANKPAAAA